jgi:hypothetical protein
MISLIYRWNADGFRNGISKHQCNRFQIDIGEGTFVTSLSRDRSHWLLDQTLLHQISQEWSKLCNDFVGSSGCWNRFDIVNMIRKCILKGFREIVNCNSKYDTNSGAGLVVSLRRIS